MPNLEMQILIFKYLLFNLIVVFLSIGQLIYYILYFYFLSSHISYIFTNYSNLFF